MEGFRMTDALVRATPDYKGFAQAVLTEWPTGDIDGACMFEWALEYGMIREVPGGYNPDHHIDADGICPEEGDPWYEYTFGGKNGPGLFSLAELRADRDAAVARAEAAEAQLAEAPSPEAELAAARAIYTPGPRQAVAEYPAQPSLEAVARAALEWAERVAIMVSNDMDNDREHTGSMAVVDALRNDASDPAAIGQIIAQAGKGAGE